MSPTRGSTTSATARLGGNGCGSINVLSKEKNGCLLHVANLGKHIVGIQSYILVDDIQTILRNINRVMMKLVRIKVEVTYLWRVVRRT